MAKDLLISRAFNVARGMFGKKLYGSKKVGAESIYPQPRKVDMGSTLSRAFNVTRGMFKK